MANLQFSVPYNMNAKTLAEYSRMNECGGNKITEVYLSGPQEFSASGRAMGKLDTDSFLLIVKRIHSMGFKVNLLMNATCEGEDWYTSDVQEKKVEYIEMLHNEHGLESVTIANPIYINIVKNRLPDIEIYASVLSDINSIHRAIIFADLGADAIVPDPSINHNLELLKEIKDVTDLKIKLMVNEGCLYMCPFRKFHINYMSHISKKLSSEKPVFFKYCNEVFRSDPSQILKSGWIRPEDMQKYGEITDSFKIVGRASPESKILRAVKAYMDEKWDGDLLDILAGSLEQYSMVNGICLSNKLLGEYGFFEKVTSCGQNCNKCNYCDALAAQLVEYGLYTGEKEIDAQDKFPQVHDS
ncbi:MAG: U32 family peptidase [Dehalococcoidales bacterium]|nr:U32 family peptidase [Dehalococcoidales bacterium]